MSHAVTADNRLPPLSAPAWAAALFAILFTLTLGFFPFVARRAADRLLARAHVSAIASFAMTDYFGPVLAFVTVITLVLGLTRARSALVYTALALSLAGTFAVYGALYSSLATR